MKNGAGPTVLVRADMDALPVEEKANLPYASKIRAMYEKGQEVGGGGPPCLDSLMGGIGYDLVV